MITPQVDLDDHRKYRYRRLFCHKHQKIGGKFQLDDWIKFSRNSLSLAKSAQQNSALIEQIPINNRKKSNLEQLMFRSREKMLTQPTQTSNYQKAKLVNFNPEDGINEHGQNQSKKDLRKMTLEKQMIKLKKLHLLDGTRNRLNAVTFPSVGRMPRVMNDFHSPKSNSGYSRSKTGGIYYK